MKFPDQLFLVSLILLALFFQVGMWREMRDGKRGGGFYPFGLIFCCVMEALCFHSLISVQTASSAFSILGSVCGAVGCLAVANGIARLRRS